MSYEHIYTTPDHELSKQAIKDMSIESIYTENRRHTDRPADGRVYLSLLRGPAVDLYLSTNNVYQHKPSVGLARSSSSGARPLDGFVHICTTSVAEKSDAKMCAERRRTQTSSPDRGVRAAAAVVVVVTKLSICVRRDIRCLPNQ